ncbi:MAG: hypothetical protein AB8F94_29330 [Saprospiraceae bacterium]
MDNKIIGIIILVFLIAFFLFINRKKSEDVVENEKAKNKYLLPEDIKIRINQKFTNPTDNKEVMKMIDEIGKDTFMVGKDQLIRSILVIADKDKNKIRQIIDSNYYGDGRDVIVESMGTPGNTNDHGMTPFERIKE